jgi:Protein of unknown function (DUF1203)
MPNKPNKIVAISTEIADTVRQTMRAPVYGFPAHKEVEKLPQPGPIYVHAKKCPRYEELAGFPEELRGSTRTLEAYARCRRFIAQEYVADGAFEAAIERLFSIGDVDYLQVNSTTAGCFTFRIERTNG